MGDRDRHSPVLEGSSGVFPLVLKVEIVHARPLGEHGALIKMGAALRVGDDLCVGNVEHSFAKSPDAALRQRLAPAETSLEMGKPQSGANLYRPPDREIIAPD